MFQKVLLAVDGSTHAEKALPVAAELAKKSDGEVLVFHAREYMVARGGSYELEGRTEANALVERAASWLTDAGVKVGCRVEFTLQGRAASAILDAAEAAGADVIVMGSRGLSDLRGLLLGSVTHKVIQLSDRTVVVAR